jgi:cytochrome P450
VIHEGLRTAHAVSSRHPRIAHSPLTYGPYTIPPGTPVAQSLYLLHTDPTIFPDPFAFRPERWIENPKLTKNLFAFSRGSQNCVGMNLATAELFIGIAMVFRKVEMELYDTSEERDVLVSNDCFIGMADLKSEGIKVRILGETEDRLG